MALSDQAVASRAQCRPRWAENGTSVATETPRPLRDRWSGFTGTRHATELPVRRRA